ncbi:hypothetical protein BJ138DRAFT_1130975 [Hygrophoropsis aurantiaca]|uniref:Uncharacterized protein n=1 Tax=Hygrophoropsis aurantiaca TaxID=72124 RepID=A0ACB7ZVK6_9AGAM|nr:hypothetical protein BJ138DRAFT_1130975 [Hygrophoropsis aurantiaca]
MTVAPTAAPSVPAPSAVPSFVPTANDQELDPDLYVTTATRAGVNFWTRNLWNLHENSKSAAQIELKATTSKRGSTRLASDENVACLYIEDKHGIPVTGSRAAAMRSCAYDFFDWCARRNLLGPTWYKTDPDIRARYQHVVRNKFFELTLCANNWKADLLAVNNFPQWHKTHVAKKIAIKDEINDDAEQLDDNDERPSKKAKIERTVKKLPKERKKPVPAPKAIDTDSDDDLYGPVILPPRPVTAMAPVINAHTPTRPPIQQSGNTENDAPIAPAQTSTIKLVIEARETSDAPLEADNNQDAIPAKTVITDSATNCAAVALENDPAPPTTSTTSIAIQRITIKNPLNNLAKKHVLDKFVQPLSVKPIAEPVVLASSSLANSTTLAVVATAAPIATPQEEKAKPIPASTSAPIKRVPSAAPMRVRKTINGRNLCAQQWKEKFPKGTATEFGAYWKALPLEERKTFDKIAADLRSGNATASTSNGVDVDKECDELEQ